MAEERVEQSMITREEMAHVFLSLDGEGLSYHTFEDIGRYTLFPNNMFKRMFPSKPFGRLEEDDHSINKAWGIMTREEGLRLTNELSKLTLPSERSVDYKGIVDIGSNSEIKKQILKEEDSFIAI